MDNPKNHIYNYMTAVENFHLVKRVMSVKPTVTNNKPGKFRHLVNSHAHRNPSAGYKLKLPV